LKGNVVARKKRLSREVLGTSHIISLAETQFVYEEGASKVIIGTDQSGMVKLSDEAAEFFQHIECHFVLIPRPESIQVWNEAKGSCLGLFHITC
jgi:hypothetical protein